MGGTHNHPINVNQEILVMMNAENTENIFPTFIGLIDLIIAVKKFTAIGNVL